MENSISLPNKYSELDLERSLENLFHPVKPDQEFVSKLHERLQTSPAILLESRPAQKAYVLVAIGLFSGALIVWLVNYFRKK